MDSGCGGESFWVTAEQPLDRIPRGTWIDDREKQRKGREGDKNMLAQGSERRKTLYTNFVIDTGSLVAFFRAFARLMRLKLIGAHSSVLLRVA